MGTYTRRTAALAGWVTVFAALFGVGCAESGYVNCTPGETRACRCDGGIDGVQACRPNRVSFGECLCLAVDGGPDEGADAEASPPLVCTPGSTQGCVCANGRSGTQTCNASGSAYLPACDGCASPCGDGVCDTGEPISCPTDCAAVCVACSSDAQCPSGTTCRLRNCDGATGCFAPGGLCDSIEGWRCPDVRAYESCSNDAQCGPVATCRRFGSGSLFCSRRCDRDTECPDAPTASGLTRACDTAQRACYLRCPGPGFCPVGMECFRFSDGSYGYCS